MPLTITKGDKPRTIYPPIRLVDRTQRYIDEVRTPQVRALRRRPPFFFACSSFIVLLFRPADLADARIAYTRRCVDFASALGVKIVTFHAGYIPQDTSDPAYQRMLRAVSTLAAYGAQHGVTISLETGQESGEELLRFIHQITVARVGVNFDTANLVLYGRDDPPKALRTLLSRVTSVHVKDGLLPVNPHLLGDEVRLGKGRGQVKECLRILQDANFRGPLIIENYVWDEHGTDPLNELRLSEEFIRSAIAEIAKPRS